MNYPIHLMDTNGFPATQIGHYQLDPFPGCSKIGISHGLEIYPQFRNKGYGKKAHAERLAEAKRLGYEVLLCTINSANVAQVKILKHYGWRITREFWNPKTDHKVTMYYKHLTDPYAEWGGT